MWDIQNLTAIIVCVDYADFLACTWPLNRYVLDNILVVTCGRDIETQKYCQDNYINYFVTEKMYEGGAAFRKAAAINAAIDYQQPTDWVVMLDADIILPKDFRQTVGNIDLERDTLYGCFRLECETYRSYQKMLRNPAIMKSFPLCRSPKNSGFFHMFHSSTNRRYSERSLNAAEYDLVFWRNAPKKCTLSILAVHLGPIRTNWNGRCSERFESPQKIS